MHKINSILEKIHPLGKEYIHTANALGRVIAESVNSPIILPEHDLASVDGYAVPKLSSEQFPVTLSVVGESSSAKPYPNALESNHAVKIYAGGRIPYGTESVTTKAVVSEDKKFITLYDIIVTGQNITPAGIDLSDSEEVFKVGEVMNARLVGLASTAHLFWLPVVRKPRVAVLAVGSELSMPGALSVNNKITASSLYSIAVNIITAGGEPVILGVVPDSSEHIKVKIKEAKGCDLLITTGATSLAAGNLMQNVLSELCGEIQLLSVELNRNDCMIYASYEQIPICSIPGNPISAQIYSTLFVRPIINKLVGMPPLKTRHGILGRNLDPHDTSVAYLHSAYRVDENGMYVVTPVSAQDGFLISALAKSHCLLIVDKTKKNVKGDLVEIITF
jgi:molybdopterin molybdotransferase